MFLENVSEMEDILEIILPNYLFYQEETRDEVIYLRFKINQSQIETQKSFKLSHTAASTWYPFLELLDDRAVSVFSLTSAEPMPGK